MGACEPRRNGCSNCGNIWYMISGTGDASSDSKSRRAFGCFCVDAGGKHPGFRGLAEDLAGLGIGQERRGCANDQAMGGPNTRMGNPGEACPGCQSSLFFRAGHLPGSSARLAMAICCGPKVGCEGHFYRIAALVSSPSTFRLGRAARFIQHRKRVLFSGG